MPQVLLKNNRLKRNYAVELGLMEMSSNGTLFFFFGVIAKKAIWWYLFE